MFAPTASRRPLALCLILPLVLTGCRHALEIQREGDWAYPRTVGYWGVEPELDVALSRGVINAPPFFIEQEIISQIESDLFSGLSGYRGRWGSAEDEVVIDINMETVYGTYWYNFFIAIPGGLFFLPAIYGFQYHMTYVFDVTYHIGDLAAETVNIECGYRMAYCNFLQGAFTEAGSWIGFFVPPIFYVPVSLFAAPFMLIYVDSLTLPTRLIAKRDTGDAAEYVAWRVRDELARILR